MKIQRVVKVGIEREVAIDQLPKIDVIEFDDFTSYKDYSELVESIKSLTSEAKVKEMVFDKVQYYKPEVYDSQTEYNNVDNQIPLYVLRGRRYLVDIFLFALDGDGGGKWHTSRFKYVKKVVPETIIMEKTQNRKTEQEDMKTVRDRHRKLEEQQD